MRRAKTLATLAVCGLLLPMASIVARPTVSQIDIEGTRVFPESLTSMPDGTIYIGGQTSGAVYRTLPGSATAPVWITPGTNGMLAVFGVLADPRTRTLWVCSVDRATKMRDATSLMSFDVGTGAFKAKYPYPGGGTCNDVTISRDRAIYATDTLNGRILRLAPGSSSFTEVVKDPVLVGADGIVATRDGRLYTNTYGSGLLLRVDPGKGGAPGTVTRIATSQPLVQPDGMRLAPDGTLLMAEGQGHLDRVDISGDSARITVLHEGYMVPSAVTVVGKVAWELETKFTYQRDPALKDQDPGVFHAYAVPLGK